MEAGAVRSFLAFLYTFFFFPGDFLGFPEKSFFFVFNPLVNLVLPILVARNLLFALKHKPTVSLSPVVSFYKLLNRLKGTFRSIFFF